MGLWLVDVACVCVWMGVGGIDGLARKEGECTGASGAGSLGDRAPVHVCEIVVVGRGGLCMGGGLASLTATVSLGKRASARDGRVR